MEFRLESGTSDAAAPLILCLHGQGMNEDAFASVIRRLFSLPAHFGHNLDALYDCVTDLRPRGEAEQPGFLVILENLPDTAAFGREQRDALLDVFRDAADFFFDRKTAFRVLYSVRAGGSRRAAASPGRRS